MQFEASDATLTMHTDSDWADCRFSKKSTSGGVVSPNIGVVRHWSSTQKSLALSSCEAELYARTKGAAETMAIKSLAADMEITFDILLRTDATAALGVVNRRGVGKTRHIDTQELWLQNHMRSREMEVQKVAGEEDAKGILTKNVKPEVLEKHVAEMEFTKTTRREMDDEVTGAHKQISSLSASAAKKTSVAQKALGALCNESCSNRSSSRAAFQYYRLPVPTRQAGRCPVRALRKNSTKSLGWRSL